MADYAFGEVTRALFDGIWSEFCDWGLELAKVRLADETLPAEVREATWWTLVEALDTYLRLLHPVMPFVTEQLWGALPHRASDPELLIVARWPGVGERDLAAEAEVDALVELVRGLRNARAEAHVEAVQLAARRGRRARGARAGVRGAPAGDRATRSCAPARALPDARGAPRGDAGRWPGGHRRRDRGRRSAPLRVTARSADADRARLEKELAEAEGFLDAARARLANEAFTSKAPPQVVEGARAREAELADQVERLRERLGR